MKPYVIGIDLGTGSAKALAISTEGSVVDSAQQSYPTLQPAPGHQEQDVRDIENAFIYCISTLTQRLGYPPEAIALSSAMHSLIPLDANHTPLSHAIIWADNRSAVIARELHDSPIGQSLYEQTGTPLHPMSPLCKLQWLHENKRDIFERAAKFVSIKEYLWFQLFQTYEVDYSIASASGLMDIQKIQWHNKALELAHIRSEQLSTLKAPTHSRTISNDDLRVQLGVSTSTLFMIGSSDGCLASIGSFVNEPRSVALTIGTSSAIRVIRPRPVLNFSAMIFNYLLDEKTYVCGGPSNNGGHALKWYAETLRGMKLESMADYQSLLNEINQSTPASNGLVFLPYVLGERAPVWNSEACGVFFGMRAHHRPADFTRAVVEGISTALYDIASHMMEAGLEITKVNVSGGFIHSAEWLQLLADLFGKRISLVGTSDASAYGAGMLALRKTGAIADFDELHPGEERSFSPDPTYMSAYRELFLRYRDIYKATRHLMV